MVHAEVSTCIQADPWKACGLLADPAKWPEIFPRTIRSVQLLRREGVFLEIEVRQRDGLAVHRMRILSPEELELEERTKRYDARFICRFGPDHGGTRLSLVAEIELKRPFGLRRLLPKPFVVHQIKRHVMKPLKTYAESRRAAPRNGNGSGPSRAPHHLP
jgi:hypothetical protein